MDECELSVGEFRNTLSNIEEGTPDPEGARRLIAEVLRFLRREPGTGYGDRLPDQMRDFLTLAFSRFLSVEGATLDSAFGIAVPGHRLANAATEDRNVRITMAVLERSGRPLSLEDSPGRQRGVRPLTDSSRGAGVFSEVAAEFNLSDTQVQDIFRDKDRQKLATIALLIDKTDSAMKADPLD